MSLRCDPRRCCCWGTARPLNADSSAPTYQHAEEIRRRNIFGEVRVGFWKEEANFRQALRQTRCPQVYVVPNFISSGYFTEQVIPRELGLAGPVTAIGAQQVGYCAPVGLHPAMTEALLRKAREVVELPARRSPTRRGRRAFSSAATARRSTIIPRRSSMNARRKSARAACSPIARGC